MKQDGNRASSTLYPHVMFKVGKARTMQLIICLIIDRDSGTGLPWE